MKKMNEIHLTNDQMDKSNTDFKSWLKAFRWEENDWTENDDKDRIPITDDQAKNAYDNGYSAYGAGCALYHIGDETAFLPDHPWQDSPYANAFRD